MSGGAAERYARAIFELGAEAGQLERLGQEINEFAASFSELPLLRRALENPVLEESQRELLLRHIARRAELSPLTVNALLVLRRVEPDEWPDHVRGAKAPAVQRLWREVVLAARQGRWLMQR